MGHSSAYYNTTNSKSTMFC